MSDKNDRTARTPRARTRARKSWQEKFLEALAETGIVSDAAKIAGKARSTVYLERERNQAFADAWDDASEVAADVLEQEAFRRAVQGVVEPVVSAGEHVTNVTRYSDRLLEFLLKARRPEKFRERHDLRHSGEVNVGISLARLHELAARADSA